eukprot:CAMPEP_0175712652 /NCGR_PEP_ID=MMETSP0097-20121207/41206_1 /TAXON_ID=311494 /ORGANISM="Alexandrium monilatum, Strain CCMP3105" /LENGTH=47 /DNA_ID= /DNA_START= /DNA_END= /DNA_ORIENTATION=
MAFEITEMAWFGARAGAVEDLCVGQRTSDGWWVKAVFGGHWRSRAAC